MSSASIKTTLGLLCALGLFFNTDGSVATAAAAPVPFKNVRRFIGGITLVLLSLNYERIRHKLLALDLVLAAN